MCIWAFRFLILSLSTELTTHLQALVMCKSTGNDTCRHISRDIWLIIIVWNWYFFGDTSCCQNKGNPVSHGMSPPPPWISFPRIKYHMVKVPHLWDFSLSPPPPQVLPWDFFRGGGGGASHMVLFPLGKFCCGFSSGEGLPYHIPSWGTFAIWYNFRGDNLTWYLFPYHEICVWGGGGDLL